MNNKRPSLTDSSRRLYVLPNLFTTASLFFGLLAIFYTFEKSVATTPESDPLKWACWFILISAVLDALDGKIARMTGTESDFGVYFDSLSDGIVFGVAPAMLMYSHLRLGDFQTLAEMTCIIYAICGVLRLARFTDQAKSEERSHFTGLPIPGAAAFVVSSYLVATMNEMRWTLVYVPFAMIGLAWLMVSRIPYPSLKSMDFDSSKGFEILVAVAMFFAAVVALGRYKEWFIFAVSGLYVIGIPAVFLLRRVLGRETGDSTEGEAGLESEPADGSASRPRIHDVGA